MTGIDLSDLMTFVEATVTFLAIGTLMAGGFIIVLLIALGIQDEVAKKLRGKEEQNP